LVALDKNVKSYHKKNIFSPLCCLFWGHCVVMLLNSVGIHYHLSFVVRALLFLYVEVLLISMAVTVH